MKFAVRLLALCLLLLTTLTLGSSQAHASEAPPAVAESAETPPTEAPSSETATERYLYKPVIDGSKLRPGVYRFLTQDRPYNLGLMVVAGLGFGVVGTAGGLVLAAPFLFMTFDVIAGVLITGGLTLGTGYGIWKHSGNAPFYAIAAGIAALGNLVAVPLSVVILFAGVVAFLGGTLTPLLVSMGIFVATVAIAGLVGGIAIAALNKRFPQQRVKVTPPQDEARIWQLRRLRPSALRSAAAGLALSPV
ncbi:MAG: hypothetical protein VX899_10810 [Myxococcota bacterium]|nr:hypothetical protein [Myxococcota bacterium]